MTGTDSMNGKATESWTVRFSVALYQILDTEVFFVLFYKCIFMVTVSFQKVIDVHPFLSCHL